MAIHFAEKEKSFHFVLRLLPLHFIMVLISKTFLEAFMNKKYVVLGLSAVAAFGVLVGSVVDLVSHRALFGSAEEKTYTITLNAETLAGAA